MLWKNKKIKDHLEKIYSRLGKRLAELHILGIENYSEHVEDLKTRTVHGDPHANNVMINSQNNPIFVDLGHFGIRRKALPAVNDLLLITSQIRVKFVFEHDLDSSVFPTAMNNLKIMYSSLLTSYCGVVFNSNPLLCENELNSYLISSIRRHHEYKKNNPDNRRLVSDRELRIRLRMLDLNNT